MRNNAVAVGSLSLLLSVAAITRAGASDDPLLTGAAPAKWYQRYLPEKLPAMDLPEYISNSAMDLAEAQVFSGRYKLSLITIGKAKAGDPVRIALVKGKANWSLGRYDEALAAVSDPAAAAADPRVQVVHAQILADLDRHAEAISLLKTLLQGHPDSIAGHYYLGQFSEDIGDYKLAREQYEWFSTPPHAFLDLWTAQSERAFENAEDVVLIARALDGAATLNSTYKDNVGLNNTILNMFVKAYDVIDRAYWPAHVAAAEFYLSHDNEQKALEELEAANAANPQSTRIDRLIGELLLRGRQFARVEGIIQGLRQVNAKSLDADLLEAELRMRTDLADEAMTILQRVLETRPHNAEAIGLAAACNIIRARPQEADARLKEYDRLYPAATTPYLKAARLAESINQGKYAIDFLNTAIQRTPWSTSARNQLGDVYIHIGQDDLARKTLEAAHALDPFNVATVNYLRLLDESATYARTETDHFIFYTVPDDQIIVVNYLAPYLEHSYHTVCDWLKAEPALKTIIQIYPDAEHMSVRTAGMPGIENDGISLGRQIVSTSPHPGVNKISHHRGRVLTHEFAHTVHNWMTEGRTPRWLTEGLAVYSEGVPFRFEWVPPELYKRASTKKMLTVKQMTDVYHSLSPGKDGEMAYMTGFWIGRYIVETYGHDAVLKLLDAYKNGATDDQAFQQAVGKPLSAFEPAFNGWSADQVKSWGYDAESAKQYKQHSDQGEQLIKQNQLELARAEFEEASKIQPLNAQPHRRLAGIALKLKQPEAARPHLEWLIPLELTDNRLSKQVAGIDRDAGKIDEAIASGETAVLIDPYDPSAHDLLQALYEKAGQSEKSNRESEVAKILRDRKEAARKLGTAAPAKNE